MSLCENIKKYGKVIIVINAMNNYLGIVFVDKEMILKKSLQAEHCYLDAYQFSASYFVFHSFSVGVIFSSIFNKRMYSFYAKNTFNKRKNWNLIFLDFLFSTNLHISVVRNSPNNVYKIYVCRMSRMYHREAYQILNCRFLAMHSRSWQNLDFFRSIRWHFHEYSCVNFILYHRKVCEELSQIFSVPNGRPLADTFLIAKYFAKYFHSNRDFSK